MTPEILLKCQKSLFDLGDEVTYLNCAYMSPLLQETIEAGIKGIMVKARPYHLGVEDFFEPLEELKVLFARLIGSDDPQCIALHPSASYGLANVCKNLPVKRGGNIVLPGGQFPSNVYVFRELASEHDLEIRTIEPLPGFSNRAEQWNQQISEAIDDDTICLSIAQCHWADGTIFNLKHLRARTREHGAFLIIDGTQSIGAMPFDIKEIQPDALICAAYKYLMGPYASALAYYGPAFHHGQPIEYNWFNRKDSHEFQRLVDYQDAYRPGAFRYNMGEAAHFIAVPMLITTLKRLIEWTPRGIQAYCRALAEPFLREAEEKGYRYEKQLRGNHLFGLYLPHGNNVDHLKKRLEKNKVFVSYRGEAIRISPHLYNEEEDMARLQSLL